MPRLSPFEDAAFDVVLSTFGVMFAPSHAVVAAEVVRVLRPGGRIGLANWDPQGSVGELFGTMAAYLPPPPPISEPPLLWRTEEHVRRLLGDEVDLQFTLARIPAPTQLDSEAAVDRFLQVFHALGHRPCLARATTRLGCGGGGSTAGDRQDLFGPANLFGGERRQARLTRGEWRRDGEALSQPIMGRHRELATQGGRSGHGAM